MEACGSEFYRGGAFWARREGAIRVMRYLHRSMRDGWQKMEEVGVHGSVTWRGGEREVCFFCEDVAGSSGFERNRGFVGGWSVGPGVLGGRGCAGSSELREISDGSEDDQWDLYVSNCDEIGTEAYSALLPMHVKGVFLVYAI